MNSRGKYVTSCPYGAEVQSLRANRSKLTQSAWGFLFILDKYGGEECYISIYHSLYYSLRVNCILFYIVWFEKQLVYLLFIPQIMTKCGKRNTFLKFCIIYTHSVHPCQPDSVKDILQWRPITLDFVLFFYLRCFMPHFQVMHLSQRSYFSTGKVITFMATEGHLSVR